MKRYVITIDTGTTNTRTFLWDEKRNMIASASASVGVHDTAIEGNNTRLKKAVHDCIESLLEQGGIGYDDVAKVIACGMITSNVGLVEVPHVFAPAGKQELADQCVSYLLEDVCPLPILFIPGVKNEVSSVDIDTFEAMDIMRGEEVETVAILDAFPAGKPYMMVLPGSHTKFVSVDATGKMTGCLTTMTGELLDCITNDTIIADAVGHKFVSEETYDRDVMLKGFEAGYNTGLGRAAFSTRILNMFTDLDQDKRANFVLGVALSSDIQCIRNSSALAADPDITVIVSGKNPLRQAIIDILKKDGYFKNIEEYIPDSQLPLSAAGSYIIAGCIQDA